MTEDKTIPIARLSEFVSSGQELALGGAWLSNHPMAAVRQLLRDRVDDLRVISTLASIEAEILIAGGAVRGLTFSMMSLEAYGLAPSFRRAAETGAIDLRELSGVAMNVAFEAGARRLPYLPMRDLGGSEIPTLNEDFYREIECPYTGERLLAVRAFEPEVAIVHATRADPQGNAQVDAPLSNDAEIARAARTVIVTCEELVDPQVIATNPSSTHIPGFLVDAVIEVPFGAHPTSHIPRYVTDGWNFVEYVDAYAAGEGSAEVSRLREESEDDYRERVAGPERRVILGSLATGAPALDLAPQ